MVMKSGPKNTPAAQGKPKIFMAKGLRAASVEELKPIVSPLKSLETTNFIDCGLGVGS
jgi:hypothetical protein